MNIISFDQSSFSNYRSKRDLEIKKFLVVCPSAECRFCVTLCWKIMQYCNEDCYVAVSGMVSHPIQKIELLPTIQSLLKILLHQKPTPIRHKDTICSSGRKPVFLTYHWSLTVFLIADTSVQSSFYKLLM
jgi:hypothetical protein